MPAGGDDIIIRLGLLEDEPLRLHVIPSVAPVALRIKVSDIELILQFQLDTCHGTGDLARDERLAADRRFVIEEDAVAGIDPLRLPVIDAEPTGLDLGRTVGTAGIERRALPLRNLPRFA